MATPFRRVNPYVGLFFFDSSFRPVPLEQHFIAAKGKPNGTQSRENLDHATFEKALELVKEGHQVLVFVHARKDTVKTGQMIREKAVEEGELEHFDSRDNPKLDMFRRELQMSRNREMKELLDSGIGIHHAGMLRTDRNLSERLFENNVTKILVCTATLAWGVNLPAYAVIIKGTQLYDSSKGAFMDLSVLDVLQMFGRAGRPQYETHGVSYICTTSDKVDHYITAVSQSVPIESKFVQGLLNSLNAEIALGTVTTVDEGVRWLGYTFLHVRMRKNPMVYGLSATDLMGDPALGNRRRELITNAAKTLLKNGMIQYDPDLETLVTTELGQIASRYYLRAESIETFNAVFKAKMTEADLLAVLSKSSEFQQVAIRDSETEELKGLIENVIPCQVKVGVSRPRRRKGTGAEGRGPLTSNSYCDHRAVQTHQKAKQTSSCRRTSRGQIYRTLLLFPTWATSRRTRRVSHGLCSRLPCLASGHSPQHHCYQSARRLRVSELQLLHLLSPS